MSEPKLLFHDAEGHLEAWSKWGVLWSEKHKTKLGSFTENKIYDCHNELVATINGLCVVDQKGDKIGSLIPIESGRKIFDEAHSFTLFYGANEIGKCDYGKAMSALNVGLTHQKWTP